MEMTQLYSLVNTTTKETIGDSVIVSEDLSNLVDVGTAVFNANQFDKFTNKLVDHIGRMVYVNRKYSGSTPSVLMDGWEYGAVMQKIASEMPEAQENESWELTDGASYDPNIVSIPKVSCKFFNKRITFEIDRTITEKQLKSAFNSVGELNAFVSMIFNEVDKSLTIKIDSLVMRTINNFTMQTMKDEFPSAGYGDGSTVKAVNLLYLYNQEYNKSLTAAHAITDPDFIRYAVYIFSIYMKRLGTASKLFNIGGQVRFTPADMLHTIMLADFQKAADIFLQSGTFHDMYTALPNAESVPFWQGSGTTYAFDDVSHIKGKTANGDTLDLPPVLAVMFDRDALGVTNVDRRVTTNYNPKGEFTNYFYKYDAGYFNDFNENFVVFYIDDATADGE